MKPIEKSPCYTCTRFPYHGMCTDNTCRAWQEWFCKNWKTTCDNLRSLGIGSEADCQPPSCHSERAERVEESVPPLSRLVDAQEDTL